MINPFTPLEHRVVLWLANGLDYESIGKIEARSESSIGNAAARARDKAEVQTNSQLIAVAFKFRWVKPDQVYHRNGTDAVITWREKLMKFSALLMLTLTVVGVSDTFYTGDVIRAPRSTVRVQRVKTRSKNKELEVV